MNVTFKSARVSDSPIDDEGELDLDEAHRRARDRFRELLAVFGLKQQEFADATGILDRVEVNNAMRGRNMYTTHRWAVAIGRATGASAEDVSAWRTNEGMSAAELKKKVERVNDDPYPNRVAAIADRGGKWSPQTVARVREWAFDKGPAEQVGWWLKLGDAYEAGKMVRPEIVITDDPVTAKKRPRK